MLSLFIWISLTASPPTKTSCHIITLVEVEMIRLPLQYTGLFPTFTSDQWLSEYLGCDKRHECVGGQWWRNRSCARPNKRTKLLKAETNYQMISLIYSSLLIQEMGNDIRHIIIFNFAIFNPFYVYGIIHIRKHVGKNILHYVHFAKEMTSSPFFNRFKFHKNSVVLSYVVI